jgi:general secretion pathway protein G
MPRYQGKQKAWANAYGFTLIELVMLLAIVSIMAAVVAPLLAEQIDRQRTSSTKVHLNTLSDALRAYHLDVDSFPTDSGDDSADLGQLVSNNAGAGGWNGPYLSQAYFSGDYAVDPWGSSIDYAHTGGTNTALLTSPGTDHTLGSADDIQLSVHMNAHSMERRIRDTNERLKLIAGNLYGSHPSAAPLSYAIPAPWANDAWGNGNSYSYFHPASAILYSPGLDGVLGVGGPQGDDIAYPLVWQIATGGGNEEETGDSDGALTLGGGSVGLCSGDNMVGFRIDNGGSTDLEVTQLQLTWDDDENGLTRIKGSGSSISCGGGSNLWVDSGCGIPNGTQYDTTTITTFCATITVPAGGSYWIGGMDFEEDIKEVDITAVFTTEPVGGGTSGTSTVSFTAE